MVAYNLPPQLTPFVGRAGELAEIATLLANPDCRLLTLIGPGGTGKTRLALEAAHQYDVRHSAGDIRNVYFVPLQGLCSPACIQPLECIIPAIAESMGLPIYQGVDPKPQVLTALQDQWLLLLLDNFEHLLDGAAVLSELLAAAPGVKLLTTSREALNLQEEWLYTVSGMAYPTEPPDDGVMLEDYGAVALFLQHARRIRPNFSLAEEQSGLVDICQLVEGMPLGLELAATWVRSLSCAEIAREIEGSLDILETTARNMPPRHRSMRAVLDQSWNLLSVTEQVVFRRLSVFRRGFTREAGEIVAGTPLRTISALVDKSLLRRNADGRYDLHELVRQYAAARLSEAVDDEHETWERHCIFYATFLQNQWEMLKGWGQKEALLALDADLENIRIAWDWAVAHRRVVELDRALHSLWFYYDTRSLYREGEDAFDRAARALDAEALDEPAGVTFARVLARQGSMNYSLNQGQKGIQLFTRSRDILVAHGTPLELAFTLEMWAETDWRLNYPVRAFRHVRKSLQLYRDLNDEWGIAHGLIWLGISYLTLDNRDKAREALLESLALNQRNGNLWGIANALHILSGVEWDSDNYAEAKRLGEESLKLSQELGLQWGVALAHQYTAFAAFRLGERDTGLRHMREALRLALDFQIVVYIAEAMTGFIEVKLDAGDAVSAVELLMVVHRHPANWMRRQTARLLTRAEKLLAPESFQAAVARGKRLDLETAARCLLAEYSISPAVIAQPTQTTPAASLQESLTERELEILSGIAEGLSNQEIADRVILALSTVKWYINQLYGKLGVSSRTQAIARARELRLLV